MKQPSFLKPKFLNKALIRNNGIARRIMLALFLFSSVITTIITGVEMYFDYRSELKDIHERIESIRKVSLPTLSESVWIAEKPQIQNQLKGLLNLEDVEFVSIVANGKTEWSAGARTAIQHVEAVLPLIHLHRGQTVTIGDLHVVASVDNVFNRLWNRLILTLVSNGLKTLLIIVFVLLVFQYMVGQHLEHISSYLRQFANNISTGADLQLNRPVTGRWRPDALDHVTTAINTMHRDISGSHRDLITTNQRLAAILADSPVAIVARDRNHIVTDWNPAAEKMFGWSASEAIGHPLRIVPKNKHHEYEAFNTRIQKGDRFDHVELLREKRDGSPIHIDLSLVVQLNPSGELETYLAFITDISGRKANEKQIEFLAYHDPLTGLPNRLLLKDRFERALAHAKRAGLRVGLLFIDLDRFKSINDTLGHDIGDEFLKEISTRVIQSVRDTDTVSRQGGDEFLVVLSNLHHPDDATPILRKLIERMREPFHINEQEIGTSASMGISIFPEDGTDFETLLKKADIAMYQAKSDGRNSYRFFDEAMNLEAVEHQFIFSGLRRALEREELTLHYQPKIDLASGAVTGAEALLRWNHPELGMVPPNRFIPVAEESGLIVPIGHWVLIEACRQAKLWNSIGRSAFSIAVNVSAVQFRRGDIENSVAQALAASGLAAEFLELELTESILIQDVENVLASVKRIKMMGVKISIDDFGTGYSSLSYLKRFDIDKLKIDQSFVRDLATDPNDTAIVRAIIQMARSMNLKTIAEGVETVEMLELLRTFHCDEAQGYYFARPMPAESMDTYLLATQSI